MPAANAYVQLAEDTARRITHSRTEWTGFLKTAARLYKYPYHEQLMIYAQRPEATACADYRVWNDRMRRYIRRGSKGIALLDVSEDEPKLRYVFDIADTGTRADSRLFSQWQLTEQNEEAARRALEDGYDVTGSLEKQIHAAVQQMVMNQWLDHRREILGIVDGSYLEGYDEFNVGASFRKAAAVSAEYALLSRCGRNPDERFVHEDFLPIFDWNTPEAVTVLGTAVSEMSEEVLRQLEIYIRNFERSQEHEPDHLSAKRRLSDSQPDRGENGETAGPVRTDAEGLPAEASAHAVPVPASDGETVSAPAGDRGNGEQADGADPAAADGTVRSDGTAQSRRYDEVGRNDEQLQDPGRGNDSERTDLQLNQTVQLSFFPTEEAQIAQIDHAESVQPSAFSMLISQNEMDHLLRTGGNADEARMKIIAEFSKQKSVEDRAAFLKSLCYGGNGLITENGRFSAWYGDDGIHIASGNTARYLRSAQVISWADAAKRMEELLDGGTFATHLEVTEAPRYERQRIAAAVWNLSHDFSDEAKALGYLACLDNIHSTNFPEETERLADELLNPEFRERLLAEYKVFLDAYRENRELMRFHFHRPQALLTRLEELPLPRREYHSDMAAVPTTGRFITEDEIAASLAHGSSFEGGKNRIYAFFQTPHTPKESADFLKKEYGVGGHTHAVSRESGSYEEHDGKGIVLKKSGCADVQMNWDKVASRISELIRLNRYFTPDEQALYDKARTQDTARNTAYNSYHAVKEAHPDDLVLYQVGDFFEMYGEDAKQAASLLDMNLTTRNIPGAGRVEMCGLPSHNLEMYVEKLRDKYDVTIAEAPDFRVERHIYTLRSIDHEAESAIDAHEAEFGADGTRVFRDPAAEQPSQPTVQELYHVDSAEETAAHLSVASSSSESNHEPERRTEPLSAVLPRIAAQGREIAPNVSAYQALRAEHPEKLIGVRVRERLLFYGTDAERAASALNHRLLQRDIPGMGENAVTGYEFGQWASAAKRLLEHGHSFVFAQLNETDRYDVINEADAKDYIPIGMELEIDGRKFVIDSVNFGADEVSLRDVTFQNRQGFPIFRREHIAFVRSFVEDQEQAYNPLSMSEEEKLVLEASSHRIAQNFHITDDHLGEGGAKTKYGWNLAAIRTLQQLEAENRPATPEEQEILSRYVGWGGLSQAFDPQNADWKKEYEELKDLLSESEYASARASTLNAHYTSPTVIRAMYEAVECMGFTSGNILEPACGVGNFFGLLPDGMTGSRLYGVELDSLTGRIAKQLYPQAEITVAGFETTNRRNFYDLAIGNVPFGNYQVSDKPYDKLHFPIHDYFFAKALDQVRPGGVVAFITSKGTMDKQNSDVRRYIARRAELLGAVRLPNNAFKANAGTEVTSDILFLQKRERPIDVEPDWVHLSVTEDGIPLNAYFAEHPEMVLGRMAWDDSMYGSRQETACLPIEGAELSQQLAAAMQNITGQITEVELPELAEDATIDTSLPADPDVKNFSYAVINGDVYYRENSRMLHQELSAAAKERVRGLVGLRACVRSLIDQQMENAPDEIIQQSQATLNRLYDDFTAQYGLINSRSNANAFASDSSYYLLCSLEILDENHQLSRKADLFSKRTIRPAQAVEHVDTAAEALAVSIAERASVDMPYMTRLSGKSEEELAKELQGVVFPVPDSADEEGHFRYVTANEYLSGNIREKLAVAQNAAQHSEKFAPNVESLLQALPKPLEASEIDVRLGATWIDKSYIQSFLQETFQPPFYARNLIKVNYAPATAEWFIDGKSSIPYNDVAAHTTYGTARASAYRILEDTLNLRDVRIYDTVQDAEGKEKRVLNKNETTLAQQKQQAIKEAFRDWIWRDADRRRELTERYNVLFNSTRPRTYSGEHITFTGMNPEIRLRPHQRDAIAHILYGGNTLLAHEVGAGKTFEMVAAVMESKRLGLCQKALFAVPNHLTEQWASEFLRLYPSANILVTTKKDFETKNRKKFCARIATGDYDAIIMGHSQFEKIPVSQERQERLLQEQIDEIAEGISELKASRAERFTIKQMERTRRQLEAKLKKLNDTERKDDVIPFEQLGVDRLYVDEAQNYKNLFLTTKMRNVAGLSTSEAQKSSDMLMKCRYLDELTGGRGVVFATGTPVSNSMTELFTMMRYLQHDLLVQKGLAHFDCWASTFGETVTAIELAPEGTGYRARTRFAKFFNLPELMNLFKEAADIKTAGQLHLPTPEAVVHTVLAKPTEIQKEMVQELSQRAAAVHSGTVDASVDNMLKITSDGRKLGLDQRLINPLLPDEPQSKVNLCVENIAQIWKEGAADKLTQLAFCDISTPKGDGSFNVYEDIRQKLIAKGVPETEIAFIHNADTEVKKKELFAKVRSGQVRVLLGSTSKMGAGTNVQDRLIALHDLDCPWRPGDLEQRKGRIVRQGNRNPQVHLYRYATEGTFDSYLWQTVENKQKFISQIMTSKSPVRSCDDVDETALSYAEIKALCAGNPLIREKMDLDIEVARLRLLKASHQSQKYQMEDRLLKYFPEQLERVRGNISGLQADLALAERTASPKGEFAGMEVLGRSYAEKEAAGTALLSACQNLKDMQTISLGQYRGFTMALTLENFGKDYVLTLKGERSHRVLLGTDPRGNLLRIDHALEQIAERLSQEQSELENLERQREAAKIEAEKPFPQEAELQEKSARLIEMDAALNMEAGPAAEAICEEEPAEPSEKTEKPSLQARLSKAGEERDEEPHSPKQRSCEEVR